jgi:hypothetical protein
MLHFAKHPRYTSAFLDAVINSRVPVLIFEERPTETFVSLISEDDVVKVFASCSGRRSTSKRISMPTQARGMSLAITSGVVAPLAAFNAAYFAGHQRALSRKLPGAWGIGAGLRLGVEGDAGEWEWVGLPQNGQSRSDAIRDAPPLGL